MARAAGMFLAGARRALGGPRGAGRGAAGAPAAEGAAPELPAFDHRPGFAGAPREEVLAAGRRHLNPALKHLYREPLFVTEGPSARGGCSTSGTTRASGTWTVSLAL